MKRIHFLTALLAMLLAAPAGAQLTTVQRYLNNGGAFRIKSRTNYGTNREYITVAGDNTISVAAASTSADDYSQIWLLEKSGTAYTLRHAGSGLYLPASVSTSNRRLTATAANFYLKYSAGNAEDNSTSYVTISTNENFSGTSCLYHHDPDGYVIRRAANNASNGVEASDWVLEQVTSPTRTQIRERLNAQLGYVNTFAADKYYRIRSAAYGSVMAEMTSTGGVACQAQDNANLAQLWKVTGSAAYTRLQNAVTEKYIQKQNGTLSVQYKTGAGMSSFTRTVLSSRWEYAQTLADANGVGLHCASTQGNNVVGWNTSADASIWYFEEVEVDEAALQAAREEYANASNLQENAEAYTQVLAKYFTSKVCSELNGTYQRMTDEQLTAAMTEDGLPEVIQQMALKVKNNAWTTYEGWDKTEKTYRVADYTAYSDLNRWTSIFRQGYLLGRLTNPTGISVSKGDQLTIYVGDVPAGHTVALEAVPEGRANGTVTDLKPGFNAITMDDAYNLFIYHFVDNTTNGGAPFTPIANYPAVGVHIEGGFVNGYFDLTKGDSNADWAQMKRHLLTAPVADLKTRLLTFHMNRDALVDAVGDEMEKLLGIWEGIMAMERSKQGLEEYEGYFNNPLSVTAPGSDYMHATTWGTYYNTSTLGSIMNYTNMNENQGSIWGPAHEMGHIHQAPINLIGTTEVSNNLYSNIAVYEQGRATSRCKSIQVTLNRFQEGLSWPDRLYSASGEADFWESTHLYWQLYQFFHIQGFKPDFYPELYKAFRRSPMNSRRQNQFVSASEDYLKFYETCCTVSGYDLTEFFAAYGFFNLPTMQSTTLNGTTRDAHYVDDYGDFYLTATQAEIDQSLRRIKNKNLKPCNIIFIEDRITAPAATYEGASSRAKKVSYATGDSSIGEIRKCGKVGQYTDFVQEDAITGTYIYKENAFTAYSEIAVSGGSGAVGFKVYDAGGNLRVLANEFTFRLPDDLRGTAYKVYAAEGNGKDVRIYREGEADPYDVNGDGSVDVGDVTSLVSIVLAGGATQPDLNGDGLVDVSDVTVLVARVLEGD